MPEEASSAPTFQSWRGRLVDALRRMAPPGVLAVITLWVFGPAFGYGFISYDDPQYVYENDLVSEGLNLDSARRAFTERHMGNWYPLTLLSYAIEIEIFGLRADVQHTVNVLIHLLTALLLYAWLRRATGAWAPSFWVAALFAIHPLHVEPVVWISSRKDVLCGLFLAVALFAYRFYTEKPSLKRYLVVLIAFLFGLMSKATLVTFPFVLLLLDGWPLRRAEIDGEGKRPWSRWLALTAEKIPLFALAAVFCVVAYTAQDAAGTLGSIESHPMRIRLENALTSCGSYLYKTVWPANLSVFYPHPENTIAMWKIVASAVTLLVFCGAAFMWRRRAPYWFAGWFWFLGSLVPVLGLLQAGAQGMADRYVYLPHMGLFIAIAWGLKALGGRSSLMSLGIRAAAALSLIPLSIAARTQVGHWRDSESLYVHSISVTEGNYRCHYNLGNELMRLGRDDEAIAHFESTLRIRPVYPQARTNLGILLAQRGEFEEAAAHLRIAITRDRHADEARYNLSMLLIRLGGYREAARHLEDYLPRNAGDIEARFNLGLALGALGETDRARDVFLEVLRRKPDHAEARVYLDRL